MTVKMLPSARARRLLRYTTVSPILNLCGIDFSLRSQEDWVSIRCKKPRRRAGLFGGHMRVLRPRACIMLDRQFRFAAPRRKRQCRSRNSAFRIVITIRSGEITICLFAIAATIFLLLVCSGGRDER